MLKVYLVQMEVVLDDKKANFKKVQSLLSQTHIEEGGLIILPEMFATGYLPSDCRASAEDFSNACSGETAKFLSEIALETHCAVLGAGIAKGEGNALYNHSSLYTPKTTSEESHYDKRRPFFPELEGFAKFTPGNTASLFKIGNWNMSNTICFDLRFPELFRDATRLGATLITVQAAWPTARIEHWITLLKARAIENQVYIAAVNQTTLNQDSRGALGGHSMVISPMGEIMASADFTEGVIQSTLLSEGLKDYRKAFPILRGIV